MSRYVAALVYRKKLGSMARKTIMAYCAERANDDGTGVWASKLTISKEVECSKQTVIDTFKAFVSEGLIREAGKRKCSNGYVVEYDLNIPAIEALEDAISREESTGPILDRSNELTPRGQAAGPQEVKPVDSNRPKTVLKPSIPPTPKGADLFSEMEEPQPKKPKVDLEAKFEEFWKVFPEGRKTEKVEAKHLFAKIVAGKHRKQPKTDAETLVGAARRYAETQPDPQYVPMPSTWLNRGRWDMFPPGSAPSRPVMRAEDYHAGGIVR